MTGVWRHAKARVRGMKRVQVEPHLSVTGACSARVGADQAQDRRRVPLCADPRAAARGAARAAGPAVPGRSAPPRRTWSGRTATTCAIAPAASRWSGTWASAARPRARQPGPAGGARRQLRGRRDRDRPRRRGAGRRPAAGQHRLHPPGRAHAALLARVGGRRSATCRPRPCAASPTSSSTTPASAQTIEIDGQTMPFRPVAVTLGKTVNNGWGGFECCWARTLLATLVGALEVPGGTLGTTVRLSAADVRAARERQARARRLHALPAEPDRQGALVAEPEHPQRLPHDGAAGRRRAVEPGARADALLVAVPRRDAQGPAARHAARRLVRLPHQPGDLVLGHEGASARRWRASRSWSPSPTRCDETNHFADVLLPDATDLESLQLWRIGGTKYQEQFWDHQGFALRQPVVATQGQARDFTDIATELARRTGLAEKYVAAINKGAGGVPLKGEHGDFSLDPQRSHSREEIWDAVCRAASAEISDGAHAHGLDWWKEHGLATKPFARRRLVPVARARRARPALRAAVPGAAAARRHRTRPPPARARHALVGRAAEGIPGAAGVEGLPGAVGGPHRPDRWPRRGLPVLAAHGAQHAVRLGRAMSACS